MGYPNVIYGDYGDEKLTHSAAPGGIPTGQLMVLPDGRKFRLARCGSVTALTAGVVICATGAVDGHGAIAGSGLLATATAGFNAVGATNFHLLNKSVAITKDQYAGGLLNVQLSAGLGHVYKIKANDSAAVSTVCKFELEEPIKLAPAASSTACSLHKSLYGECITYSRSALVTGPLGVTPVAVSVNYYFWAQRGGPASVKTSGTTVTVGQVVEASTVTSGSVAVALSTNNSIRVDAGGSLLGFALEGPTAAEAALVDLTLER